MRARPSGFDGEPQVRDALSSGKGLYSVDRERLQQLAPDVIVTQARPSMLLRTLPATHVTLLLQRDSTRLWAGQPCLSRVEPAPAVTCPWCLPLPAMQSLCSVCSVDFCYVSSWAGAPGFPALPPAGPRLQHSMLGCAALHVEAAGV